jgi:cell division protein ZapA
VTADSLATNIRLLDKEYTVSCPEDEREALFEVARFLDGRMREVRDSSRVIGIERIAVMTALNLAHELLRNRESRAALESTIESEVRRVTEKLERALRGDIAGQSG